MVRASPRSPMRPRTAGGVGKTGATSLHQVLGISDLLVGSGSATSGGGADFANRSVAAGWRVESREVGLEGCGVWMLAEAVTLEQFECSLIELASVAVVAVTPTYEAQRAERGHKFGVVRSERVLLDREGWCAA
jgi:hypothetical protein